MGRVIELSPSSNHRVSDGLREILNELESSESSGSSVVGFAAVLVMANGDRYQTRLYGGPRELGALSVLGALDVLRDDILQGFRGD